MILIGNWLQFGSGKGKNQKAFNLFIHRNPLMGETKFWKLQNLCTKLQLGRCGSLTSRMALNDVLLLHFWSCCFFFSRVLQGTQSMAGMAPMR